MNHQWRAIILVLCLLLCCGCTGRRTAEKWDASVLCAEKSTEEHYVITCCEACMIPKTGTLTIQNRNKFEITVHLLTEGEEERVSDRIMPGGVFSWVNLPEKTYTLGIHADVDENTQINVIAYDGKNTDPYVMGK